jgi:hypothetical protein
LVACDEPGPSDPVRIVDISAEAAADIATAMTHGNEIAVAESGGDYTTIREALLNASARDVITVYPGIYVENNPLPAVANVTIKAAGGQNNTRITAQNANQDLFTSANFFIVDGFSLSSVTGTGWLIDITADHSVVFRNCIVFQCERGFTYETTPVKSPSRADELVKAPQQQQSLTSTGQMP